MFWKDPDGNEKDLEMVNSSGPEKDQFKAWCQLTVEEAEAGLLDADVFAMRQWWLERRLVLMC